MARYIDADLLIKNIANISDLRTLSTKTIGEAISNTPTADVVEVVRCGQCKYWKINPNNLYGGMCKYSDCASIDHYCSYGERKNKNDL